MRRAGDPEVNRHCLRDGRVRAVYDITKYDGNARTFKRARDAYDLMLGYIETSVQSVWRRQIDPSQGGMDAPPQVPVLNRSTLAVQGAE